MVYIVVEMKASGLAWLNNIVLVQMRVRTTADPGI